MSLNDELQRSLTPWGRADVGEDVSGLRNRVWKVRINGQPLIARRSARPPEVLDWELDLLEELSGKGFTVPAPIPTSSGDRHVQGLAVFTVLSGREPEGDRDWQLVAEELRRLHALTLEWPQRPGFRTHRELLAEDVGGDANMALLPPENAALCRDAWDKLPTRTTSVIHGDPSPGNVLIDGDRVGLLDWDEARIDSPLLDLSALPNADIADLSPDEFRAARRAATAWEVAVCWQIEDDYAGRRLRELRELSGQP
jgi:Ser/Thr protein kinase RdoA (MazF antagonist)